MQINSGFFERPPVQSGIDFRSDRTHQGKNAVSVKEKIEKEAGQQAQRKEKIVDAVRECAEKQVIGDRTGEKVNRLKEIPEKPDSPVIEQQIQKMKEKIEKTTQ